MPVSATVIDEKKLSRSISTFVARKTHKDPVKLSKVFWFDKVPSNQALVKMFNNSIYVAKKDESQRHTIHDSSRELSYKTRLVVEHDLLQKMPGCTYLDHGCGSGKITREIADYLGADIVYGVDIYSHELLAERNIISVNPSAEGHIRLPDNSVDIITCFLSMHHVDLQEITTQELVRILRPGGTLLLYEHDYDGSPILKKYLDAVHLFYQIYGTQNEFENANDISRQAKKITLSSVDWIFSTKYASREHWRNIFESNGPMLVRSTPVSGMQRMYFDVFRKK